jgi:hypothetical protein
MRHLPGAIAMAATLALATYAFGQSSPAPAPAAPAAVNPAAPAVPVPSGKRLACRTASLGMTGQEQKDQMQVCMMQARLDCLKQAIDQKIVGPQRKDFVKSCAE